MRELVIISGKGGTGKTSLTAAFASLAKDAVLADCDVDAADLHLLLQPQILERHEFRAGHEAVIRHDACCQCGICHFHCRFDAVRKQQLDGPPVFSVDVHSCEGCGVCVDICPARAIDFPERVSGEWYVSRTCHGDMVHARLGAAAENSGKLVSVVRREAQRLAKENDKALVLVDGPPGIGCPVIASVTGASAVLIVTEPTVSGRHDMERVAKLARHFRVPAGLCINKWDLNPDMASALAADAGAMGIAMLGRVRYDRAVTDAMVAGRTLVEHWRNGAADDVRDVWMEMNARLL